MSESFEEWMRRQMGEPSEEAQEDPYTPAELVELLERYNLPSQAMLLVFERVMPVWRALANHSLSEGCELTILVAISCRLE
jgi:hypothetical protein